MVSRPCSGDRVVAKVEWHNGELFPCVGFKRVVRFYNQRGTAEQWIKEGKNAVKWTCPARGSTPLPRFRLCAATAHGATPAKPNAGTPARPPRNHRLGKIFCENFNRAPVSAMGGRAPKAFGAVPPHPISEFGLKQAGSSNCCPLASLSPHPDRNGKSFALLPHPTGHHFATPSPSRSSDKMSARGR